jgi:hypothetical protein
MSVRATRDRCDIIHLAGRLRLSPAVRDGNPLLVPVGDQAGRCGWEPFFAALDRGGRWVAEDEGGMARVAPRATVP